MRQKFIFRLHHFILALLILLSGSSITHAQLAPLDFVGIEAHPTSQANTVNLTWTLNRVPTAEEPMQLTIFYKGTKVFEGLIGSKKTQTHTLRGALGEKYALEFRNTRTNAVKPTTEVTVTAAVPETNTNSGDGFEFKNTLFGNVTAPQYIRSLYIWSVGIAILGASIMMIYAGYKYTASRGNPTELSSAKEIIISSLVGLALLLLSFTILRFLGVNVQNITTGTSDNRVQTQQNQTQTQQNSAPVNNNPPPPANVNPPVDPSNQFER